MRSTATISEATYYLAAARSAPELDREQEAELLRRWKTRGDRRAANQLARAHFRQVVAMAFKLRRYGVPLGELIAEGNVGVVQALDRFELERGVRFGTYASYWVRAQMLAHVVKSHSSVGGSDGPMRSQLFFKLRRERARVANQLGSGEAAERELAGRFGVSVERVRGMLERLDGRDVSLESQAGSRAARLLDELPAADDQEGALFSHQVRGRLTAAVDRALARLDPRERFIVERRIMADANEALTLAEIARRLRVSRERARQLEARAKAKLHRLFTDDACPVLREWRESELPIPRRSAA